MTAEQTRLTLSGGPASDWLDEEKRIMPRSRWTIAEPWTRPDGLPVPDAVWLCRVEWGYPEWRVRDHPEPIRGRSALYWLERERDDSPKQTPDGAFMYAHVPDGEVSEYVPPDQVRWARGVLHMREPVDQQSGEAT